MNITDSLAKRFLSKFTVGDDCWEWTAGTTNGYGRIWSDKTMLYAHRVSCELFVGPIPEGLHVLHSCHNPICVRPDHLRFGTHQDNIDDMVAAGRQSFIKLHGEKNGQAKLTETQVAEIRDRYSRGGIAQRKLANEYGVCQAQIARVVNHKRWTHVE